MFIKTSLDVIENEKTLASAQDDLKKPQPSLEAGLQAIASGATDERPEPYRKRSSRDNR